jgi:hypothetical protein
MDTFVIQSMCKATALNLIGESVEVFARHLTLSQTN